MIQCATHLAYIMLRILTSKVTFVIALLLLGFFMVGYVRTYMRDFAVEKEIRGLEGKQAQLEKNRIDLADLLKKVQTNAFVEAQARQQLGLRKPGEKSVIFQEEGRTDTQQGTPHVSPQSLSNPQKWWHYFFGGKK